MKKGFIVAFLLNIVILTLYFQSDIVDYINKYIYKDEIIEQQSIVYNDYKSNFNYLYISETDKILPNNIEQLRELYYTVLNSGMSEYSFYCPDDYVNCFNDISSISNDSLFLGTLNNYVHPYNSYQYIATNVYGSKNTIMIQKNYSDEMISILNKKVEEIISENINDTMSDREKIRVIHDYIINHTKYDKTKGENSHLAYGALIDGSAICGGYTDAMSIFLYRFNIPNFKISTEEHIWNVVYLDGNWYHLDLTWDDPVNEILDILSHNYFLITDEELSEKNDGEHNYNKDFYLELSQKNN